MPNPVVVDDLAVRFRPLTDAESPVAEALLADAWAILLTSVPDLEARRTSGAISDGVLTSVVASMVLRVIRNPEGIRQWSIDDASFTRDTALSAGGLYLSDAELALLTGTAGRRRGAFSVAPASVRHVHSRGAEWPCW